MTTTEADTVAPHWVGNLKALRSGTTGGVDLTCSAPADFGPNNSGPFTCAAYQLRYSTSLILYDDGDATWNAATAVTGLPKPQAPGSVESFTVSGLDANTTYYFAIKAVDDAMPANNSEVCNCAAGVPSAVGNLVLQNGVNGYGGTEDSYYVSYGTSSYPGNERMIITGFGTGNIQRGIIKFDFSSLPDINITSATLSLYSYYPDNTKGTTGAYGLYAVTTDWVCGEANWNSAMSGVSSGHAWRGYPSGSGRRMPQEGRRRPARLVQLGRDRPRAVLAGRLQHKLWLDPQVHRRKPA